MTAADFGGSDLGLIKNLSASLEDLTAQNVEVYPNPATDVVNISFENTSDTYISIMDLQGRVLGTKLLQEQTELKLFLSQLKDLRKEHTWFLLKLMD